jgi:hypothetical protein
MKDEQNTQKIEEIKSKMCLNDTLSSEKCDENGIHLGIDFKQSISKGWNK